MVLFNKNEINKIIPLPATIFINLEVVRYVERLRDYATFKYQDALNVIVDFCELVQQGYQLAFEDKIKYSYLRDTLQRVRAITLTHFIYLQEQDKEEVK